MIKLYKFPEKYPLVFKNEKIINYFFKDVEFILHLGAHKTATTYIQKILEMNKYDLALNGILLVDFDIFRSYINKYEDNSKSSIVGAILKSIIPNLFFKPKRIIISDENIIYPNKIKPNQRMYNISSCSPIGFKTDLINNLVNILPKIKLFFALRDYKEYLISLHAERCIWSGYFNLDQSLEGWDLNNFCNWKFVISKLSEIINNKDNSELLITRYEDYKKDPLKFASLLAGIKLNYMSEIDNNDRKIIRYRATQETIDMVEKYSKEENKKSIDDLYIKLLNYNYGSTKYIPEFTKNNPFFNYIYSEGQKFTQGYFFHCKDIEFININNQYSKLSTIDKKFSFQSLINLNNILINPRKEKFEDFKNNMFTNFSNPQFFKNLESNSDYFYYRDEYKTKKGLSAMLRVKNEEKNIKNVLLGIKNVFNEIVLIDNNSQDNTLKVVKELMENEEELKEKIKIFDYPFDIARCGMENFKTHPRSLHSLTYFYNYCLSKCSFSHVMKWDGDMFLPYKLEKEFKLFISKLMDSDMPVLGIIKGLTVFKGFDANYYYRKNSYEEEIRIFNNLKNNYFTKDVLWEKFQSDIESQLFSSSENLFIEFKDVSTNEYSHWNSGDLGMGMRKRRELRDFKIIADITSNNKYDIATEIENVGFKSLKREDIFN